MGLAAGFFFGAGVAGFELLAGFFAAAGLADAGSAPDVEAGRQTANAAATIPHNQGARAREASMGRDSTRPRTRPRKSGWKRVSTVKWKVRGSTGGNGGPRWIDTPRLRSSSPWSDWNSDASDQRVPA